MVEMIELESEIQEQTCSPYVATNDSDVQWLTDFAFQSLGKNIELNKAFLEFQRGLQAIAKDSNNPFGGYTYASLDAIMADVLPRLTQQGLVLKQYIGREHIVTTVTHAESGQFFGELTPIVAEVQRAKMSAPQLYGSGVTYCRRYALGLLGITTSVDDDASGETTEKIKRETIISAEVAQQLIAEMIAIGYGEDQLNAAVAKSLGKGKTIYQLPEEKLPAVKQWIATQQKQAPAKPKDEEVV